MTRRLGTAIRRRGRDHLVGVIAIITALAALVALGSYLRGRALAENPTAAVAVEQVDRARSISERALRAAEGDTTATEDLAAILPTFERTHHGLRYGDSELGLPGAREPQLQLLFTGIEPVFDRTRRAIQSLVAAPQDVGEASTLIAASTDYAAALKPVISTARATSVAAASTQERFEVGTLVVVLAGAVAILLAGPLTRRKRRSAEKAALRLRRSLGELDHLTGLPRKAALRDHLAHLLHEVRSKTQHIGLLVVDVDGAREFNADRGRAAGDRMLQEVAHRLRASVRGSDLVVRTDADEFAVVIAQAHRPEDVGLVAQKISEMLALPMVIDGDEVAVGTSIGVAVAPADGDSPDELLDKATMALHAAKRMGGNRFEYFSAELGAHTQGRLQLIDGLRTALRTGDQLWIAYQPQISVKDGTVVGAEALVRWTHPVLGGLLPAEFVPVAEETELILELGQFVLEGACRQAASWRRSAAGPIPVSVNVSARQFRHGDLHDVIAGCLDRYGLPADLLEIELTEGVIMDDSEGVLRTMNALHDLGVRIAVDDFGTGYSSLSYLKRFPIDSLKIDRSFIHELREDSEDAAISTAIIALAHSLDLQVVAEGVETPEQLAVLRSLDCDTVQGFLLARPLPASAVDRIAKAGRVEMPWMGHTA